VALRLESPPLSHELLEDCVDRLVTVQPGAHATPTSARGRAHP
jgi:hypothetical protein